MAVDPEKIEVFLDKRIAQSKQRVEIAIRQLEQKIIDLVDDYNAGEKVDARIKMARNIQKESIKNFELFYNDVIPTVIDFAALDAFVEKVYGDTFEIATKNTMKAAAGTTLEGYKSVGSDTLAKINQTILDYAIVGQTKSDMRDVIAGFLSGTKDVAGKDMASRAVTFTQDAIMRYHNTANLMLAEQAGVTSFKYYGNIMSTTRPFCREHLGQVKTREEWEEIGDGTWQGKAPGSIMLNVGGYGCRHHFVPVLKKSTN